MAYHSRVTAKFITVCACLLAPPLPAQINVTEFGRKGIEHLEHREFEGKTTYQVVDSDAGKVLMARSENKASGLYKKIKINLNQTPYIHWRWKVGKLPDNRQERKKAGDDFAARVYVVVSGGIFFWQTYAISYVWSASEPKGEAWKNPFTGNAYTIALRSGKQHAGQWVSETRNVKEDFKRYFDKDIDTIDAVAVMTDMDNTRQTAEAFYGDIYFSAHE